MANSHTNTLARAEALMLQGQHFAARTLAAAVRLQAEHLELRIKAEAVLAKAAAGIAKGDPLAVAPVITWQDCLRVCPGLTWVERSRRYHDAANAVAKMLASPTCSKEQAVVLTAWLQALPEGEVKEAAKAAWQAARKRLT